MEDPGFLTLLTQALALAKGAMLLDPIAFKAIVVVPYAGALTLIVIVIAGLSDILGQSMVLFANRVSSARFVTSILGSILALIVSVFVWAASIWIVGSFLFSATLTGRDVLRVVALSYAPLIFGVFVFLPYLGNIIYRLLRIWVLLALLVGIDAVYSAEIWQTILACALGWVAYELITRFPVVRPDRLSRWWWRITTGTPEPIDIQAKADEMAEQGRLLLFKGPGNVSEGKK